MTLLRGRSYMERKRMRLKKTFSSNPWARWKSCWRCCPRKGFGVPFLSWTIDKLFSRAPHSPTPCPYISYLHGKAADWLQTGWEIWPLRLWRPSFREATPLLPGYSWGMCWQEGQLKMCVVQIESQTYPRSNDYYGRSSCHSFRKAFHFWSRFPLFSRSKPLIEMRCPSFLRPKSLWFLKSKWKS